MSEIKTKSEHKTSCKPKTNKAKSTDTLYSRIVSTGSFLPENALTNHDLEKTVDTSHEWIIQRTGICKRHIVSENESAASMAIEACKNALNDSGLNPKDIDMIVVASVSSDKIFPSIACYIQESLNIPPCPAFDLTATCGGFIYGISVADKFIKTGDCKRVLVVGSEAMSRLVNWDDRKTCVLFGDGAGAVILEASHETGILSTHLMADGAYSNLLHLDNARKTDYPYIQMSNGSKVFRLAVGALGDAVVEAIEKNNMAPSDVDWIVPHQANIRIIQATAKKLGISMDKVIVTIDEHANTSAASVPLALDVAVRDGRIKRGHNLLLEAFGAGLIWGSALVQF